MFSPGNVVNLRNLIKWPPSKVKPDKQYGFVLGIITKERYFFHLIAKERIKRKLLKIENGFSPPHTLSSISWQCNSILVNIK